MYLAHAYHSARDAAQAEFWYKQALDAGVLEAIGALANFYWQQGRFAEVEQVLLVGVAQNDPLAMRYLARLYMQRPEDGDRWAEVKDLLERSMKMGQVWSKNHLAFLLMKGRYGLSGIPRGVFLYLASIVDGIRLAHTKPDDRRFR